MPSAPLDLLSHDLARPGRSPRPEPARAPTLQRLYRARFQQPHYRTRVWQVLAPWFRRWLHPAATVLDLGAGYCEFINAAPAARKYAMDLNPDLPHRAAPGVRILQQDCAAPWPLPDAALDTVFTSNFLEHLPDKPALTQVLRHAHRCLKPGGRLLAMGPNIRYTGGAYWDFYDHTLPLTDRSLAEALASCGFLLETVVPRFLPYTMSAGRQYPLWMLRLYLALPPLWPLFGKQFLLIARKPDQPAMPEQNSDDAEPGRRTETAGTR